MPIPLANEKVERLRQWFREHPSPTERRHFRDAAAHGGCDWRVAKKYYEKTFSHEIAEARTLARAELTKQSLKAEREVLPDLSAKDAAAQIAREALICRGVSMEVLHLVGQVSRLRKPLRDLITRIEQDPTDAAATGGAEAITRLIDRATGTAFKSIQLERLRLGDPGLIVGVKPLTEQPSLPQLEAELQAAARGVARVRAQRALEGDDVGVAQ